MRPGESDLMSPDLALSIEPFRRLLPVRDSMLREVPCRRTNE